jgi:hypothetical protein
MVSWLVMEGHASVNQVSSGGAVPLHIASLEGHLSVCQVCKRLWVWRCDELVGGLIRPDAFVCFRSLPPLL